MSRGTKGREKGLHFEQSRNPDSESGAIIKISGSFLLDHEEEILNLVNKEGKLANERNPKAQVSEIKKEAGVIWVTTSEHNLGLKIGKALSSAYKGEHQYKFRDGEKFVEVFWHRD
jgi:hypothetical protein